MLTDDKEHLIEVFIDGMVWGNIKIDFTRATTKNAGESIKGLTKLMGDWLVERKKDPESREFQRLTFELYADLLGSRLGQFLVGDLIDRSHEEKLRKLEADNEKLAGIIADQKKQLDQLYLESPDKKNIRGIS
jgi:hypothetical protein